MKKYLIVLLFIPLIYSCKQEVKTETGPEMAMLSAQNDSLMKVITARDSTISAFAMTFNDIQNNLSQIKEKQKMISVAATKGETADQKEMIMADLQAINDLMSKNRTRIGYLQRQLRSSNDKNTQLAQMVSTLNNQLTEKSNELIAVNNELAKTNISLRDLFMQFNDSLTVMEMQKEELNTAYFAMGTYKDLKTQGILTKKGGFIGIGRTKKVMQDFNKDFFTRIDMYETTSIPLNCKKAKLITNHPSNSYVLDGNGITQTLVIKDPKDFWSSSKYLVVEVVKK